MRAYGTGSENRMRVRTQWGQPGGGPRRRRPRYGQALRFEWVRRPFRRSVEWRPLTKIIAYLLAAAVLITWLPSVTTGPNAVFFALMIPALLWLAAEMRRLK